MLSHATPSCGHLWIMTHECAPSRILRAPHLTPLLQICASPRLLARPLSRRATGSHPSKSHSSHRIHRASGFLQAALPKLPREKSRANRASWSGAALIGSYRLSGLNSSCRLPKADRALLRSSLSHDLCRIVPSSSGEGRRGCPFAEASDPGGSRNGSTEMRS